MILCCFDLFFESSIKNNDKYKITRTNKCKRIDMYKSQEQQRTTNNTFESYGEVKNARQETPSQHKENETSGDEEQSHNDEETMR